MDNWTRVELCLQDIKVDFNEEPIDLTTDSLMMKTSSKESEGEW